MPHQQSSTATYTGRHSYKSTLQQLLEKPYPAPFSTTPVDTPLVAPADATIGEYCSGLPLLPTYSFPVVAPGGALTKLRRTDSLPAFPASPDQPMHDASAPAPPASASSSIVAQQPHQPKLGPRRTASDLDFEQSAGPAPWRAMGASLLDATLLALWEDRADQGLFRYDVTTCPTREVPGAVRFVAQLNEGRATKKRPTEFTLDKVVQPFDPAKFNFTKARMGEVLLQFAPSPTPSPSAADSSSAALLPAAPAPSSPHLLLINVSPIERGHVLLIPHALSGLPQRVDAGTALLALQFARELGSSATRVGFNSIGAYGTINHLHFHAYQLEQRLPCEDAATAPLLELLACAAAAAAPGEKRRREGVAGACAVRVSALVDYPVRGFVIEAVVPAADTAASGTLPRVDDASLERVAALLGNACEALAAANVPHNFVVTDGGRRAFLWPQCFAEQQAAGAVPAPLADTGINPAAFEIAGHLLLKRQEDYDAMDEGFATALLGVASLDEGRFAEVTRLCFPDASA